MRKKVVAIAILLLFAGFTGWLIIEGAGPEILPEGSALPEINYISVNGNSVLKPDTATEKMIIYFNTNCDHCKYELSQLNKNVEKFKNIKVYLFTSEKDLFKKPAVKSWSNLYKKDGITFGIIQKSEYENKFGSMITPSIFIFNSSNKLTRKIRGEIKIESLLKDLKI